MTAATVVSTCSLKVRSETSRLFLAMWICRELTAGPNPCSRCWVMLRPSEELVEGLKSLRGLLLVTELLFSPRLSDGAGEKALLDPEVPHVWRSGRENWFR